MSNEETSYSREQKAGIVLEVVSAETGNPKTVLESHGVTATQVLSWARELGIDKERLVILIELAGESESVDHSGDDNDIVELESDNEQFLSEVAYGVSYDRLNYKRLTFWSLFGIGFVVLTALALHGIYNFSADTFRQNTSAESIYYDIEELKLRDDNHLSTFGVVDYEEGVYRVPVDSIISRMAQD